MKKFLSLVVVASALAVVTGCGDSKPATGGASKATGGGATPTPTPAK